MSLIEIIAVIFSLLCIWLATKQHILNWPVGLIGVTAYLILFYQVKLYADMCLQLIFILQGIYGWYNWKKQKTELEITRLSKPDMLLYATAMLIFSVLWSLLLIKYTDASTPFVDAFVSTISLAANWMMAKKKVENWILWILADLIYIGLFWYKDLYLSSAVYAIFLILAIKGLKDWNQKSAIKKDLL